MLKKYNTLKRENLKKEIFEEIENPKFWEIVDTIDWRKLIKGGWKHSDYHKDNYVEKAKQILHTFNDNDIKNAEDVYKNLKDHLMDYFETIWLSNKWGPSDDGYWDLISSMIGFGKDHVLSALNDDDVFLDMSEFDKYAENFGYIFND